MKEIIYTVTNPLGIHARCAGLFAERAMEFKSAVTVNCNGKCGNGKQVLDILNLGALKGDQICVRIEGVDEEDAVRNLSQALPSLCS